MTRTIPALNASGSRLVIFVCLSALEIYAKLSLKKLELNRKLLFIVQRSGTWESLKK
jgi:hypothetical protein